MSTLVHLLMILSDGEVTHSKLHDSKRSLAADLIEYAQDPQQHDPYLIGHVRRAMDDHDTEALQADYPEGVAAQLPEAEDYIDTVSYVLKDVDFDIYIEPLEVPGAGAGDLGVRS